MRLIGAGQPQGRDNHASCRDGGVVRGDGARPAAAPSGAVYRLHRSGWQSGGMDDTVAGGAMARSGALFGIVWR